MSCDSLPKSDLTEPKPMLLPSLLSSQEHQAEVELTTGCKTLPNVSPPSKEARPRPVRAHGSQQPYQRVPPPNKQLLHDPFDSPAESDCHRTAPSLHGETDGHRAAPTRPAQAIRTTQAAAEQPTCTHPRSPPQNNALQRQLLAPLQAQLGDDETHKKAAPAGGGRPCRPASAALARSGPRSAVTQLQSSDDDLDQ